jgi:hypothetical protein
MNNTSSPVLGLGYHLSYPKGTAGTGSSNGNERSQRVTLFLQTGIFA